MNRILKFRAWDKEKNEWYKPTHEAYKGNLWELFISFSGSLCAHTIEGMKHESLWPDRYVLMQYTGLKDKNGKEIYEGDVVAFTPDGHDYYKNKVCYLDGGFYVGAMPLHIVTNPEQRVSLANNTVSDGEICKVIGNIYENPELLTTTS